jgi:hypothetical protein
MVHGSQSTPIVRGFWLQFRAAREKELLDSSEIREIETLRRMRNFGAHGQLGWEEMVTPEVVNKTRQWATRLKKLAAASSEA